MSPHEVQQVTNSYDMNPQKSQNGVDVKVAAFLENVEQQMRVGVEEDNLMRLSDGLLSQMQHCLVANPHCMLPSYNHLLPSGDERGDYLTLDVGGSTFRVALVQLLGRQQNGAASRIVNIRSFKIDQLIRQLKGIQFFDWLAGRIAETLATNNVDYDIDGAISMGLAWSFPIEQTSLRSGRILDMGKGFAAADGLMGEDLGDLIQLACERQGLNVKLNAIVNDSSATLLSKAYSDRDTRFGLILGTGVNAAVHLPVHVISAEKYGTRPQEWHDGAKHVIVNTELSMFGGGVLPFSKWDRELNAHHSRPDFQPFEHFVGGGYLGEIARLILIDAIKTTGIFAGDIPEGLTKEYSLNSEVISGIETDESSNLLTATKLFHTHHPSPSEPSHSDILALRTIASHVSYRAAAVLAAGVHALWRLRNNAEGIEASATVNTVVAFNGSVLESYPGLQQMCQKRLDELTRKSGAGSAAVLELEHAVESSLLGAAVAVASLQ